MLAMLQPRAMISLSSCPGASATAGNKPFQFFGFRFERGGGKRAMFL
jgi:hypothetical protein